MTKNNKIIFLEKSWLNCVDYIDEQTALELRKALKEYSISWFVNSDNYSKNTMAIFSQWESTLS